MKRIYSDYLKFLKCPLPAKSINTPVSKILLTVVVLFATGFTFNLAYVYFINLPLQTHFGIVNNSLDNMADLASWEKYLILALCFPIAEELIFRFYLTKSRLSLSILSIPFLYALFVIGKKSGSLLVSKTVIVAAPLLFAGIIYFAYRNRRSSSAIDRYFNKYYPAVFWFSCILFASVHFSNFSQPSLGAVFITPLLAFPQFLSGSIMGYTRIKYGMWTNILVHILNNSLALGIELMGY